MSYCSTADIEAEVKALDLSAAGTVPSTAQVTEFIEQEGARIDSYLSARYVIPVTGTKSLSFLKRICIALVAWRVSDIISTKKTQLLPNGVISQDTSGATAYKQAIKDLEAIRRGDMSLPDQAVKESSTGKSYFASQNLEDDRKPVFDMSDQQW